MRTNNKWCEKIKIKVEKKKSNHFSIYLRSIKLSEKISIQLNPESINKLRKTNRLIFEKRKSNA